MICPNDACNLPERIAELEADLKQSEIVIRAKMDVICDLQLEGKRALEHMDNLSTINRDLREKNTELERENYRLRDRDYWRSEHDRIYHAFVAERRQTWLYFDIIEELGATEKIRVKREQRRIEGRITSCIESMQKPSTEWPKPVIDLRCARCGSRTFKSSSKSASSVGDIQCAECDSLGPFVRVPLTVPKITQHRIAERRQREITIRAEAHRYLQNGPAEQSFHIHTADDMAQAIKALLHAAGRGKALQVTIQEAV